MGSTLFREIASLEAIDASWNNPKDLPSALKIVVDSAVRLIGADRGAFILFDWNARLVRHYIRGGPGWEKTMTTLSFEELSAGLSGWALRTGQVALSPKGIPDSREDPVVQRRRRETECGSVVVAPLVAQEERLGTFTLINSLDQPDFTQEDADALGLYARFVVDKLLLIRSREDASQARTEAKAATRSKMSFLSNLSHELRTPLNGILGFSHLLDNSPLAQDQKLMVQTILQSGQRLLSTVDNILELAQFEAGHIQLETSPFSPRSVLDAVLAKYRAFANEKRLSWSISTSADLPSVLEGDAVRIGQAWGHILSNAVKFTDHGSISVRLEARKIRPKRYELVLNVNDTGIGLSADRSGQWFMPFHQEDGSLTRKFGGTGLGLALCDRIVRRMGGGLSLLGELGVGTKVRVWVELGPEEAWPEAGFRVLLQDPDPVSRMVLAKMLEKEGHRVDVVAPVEQAMDRLGTSEYDIVILESVPPEPEGKKRLQALAAETSLCLVGLRSLGNEPAPDADFPWTATLTKPPTYRDLQTALRKCLAGVET